MEEQFIRTAMIFGPEGVEKLKKARVAVFGIGGVGGHVAEALARSGVGALDLIDKDEVSVSNINRQIIATHDTVGMPKTLVMKNRIAAIHPECQVMEYRSFYLPENRDDFPFREYDYIVDAIDTVTSKIDLAVLSQEYGIPLISSMGTGNKIHPDMLKIADIYQTNVCPLAKVMRRELKKRGVKRLKVVYSEELAIKPYPLDSDPNRRSIPGSNAFVPATAGLLLASEVIKDLIEK